MAMKDYLTLRDAAKFLGLNKITLWGYYRQKHYKGVRIDKKSVKKTVKGLYFNQNILIKLYTALYGIRPLSLSVLKEQQKENENL